MPLDRLSPSRRLDVELGVLDLQVRPYELSDDVRDLRRAKKGCVDWVDLMRVLDSLGPWGSLGYARPRDRRSNCWSEPGATPQ